MYNLRIKPQGYPLRLLRFLAAILAEAEGFEPPWAFTPKLFSRLLNNFPNRPE